MTTIDHSSLVEMNRPRHGTKRRKLLRNREQTTGMMDDEFGHEAWLYEFVLYILTMEGAKPPTLRLRKLPELFQSPNLNELNMGNLQRLELVGFDSSTSTFRMHQAEWFCWLSSLLNLEEFTFIQHLPIDDILNKQNETNPTTYEGFIGEVLSLFPKAGLPKLRWVHLEHVTTLPKVLRAFLLKCRATLSYLKIAQPVMPPAGWKLLREKIENNSEFEKLRYGGVCELSEESYVAAGKLWENLVYKKTG